jgi:transcriptional regulator with XRE-family HTH domain
MAEQASGDRTIGANLRKSRENLGWSRETLSRESGISVATIARVELYGQLPTIGTLSALARALKVSPVALWEAPDKAGAA